MSISVTCPSGHSLKVADDWGGRSGLCPMCRKTITVPKPAPRIAGSSRILQRVTAGGESRQNELDEAGSAIHLRTIDRDKAAPRGRSGANGIASIRSAGASTKALAGDALVKPADRRDPVSDPRDFPVAITASRAPARASEVESFLAVESIAKSKPRPAAPVQTTGVASIAAPPIAGYEGRRSLASAGASNALSAHPSASQTFSHRGVQRVTHGRSIAFWLSAALVGLSFLAMAPALRYWNLPDAPEWARAVLLLSLLQLAYAAWLATVPDWASLWVSMIFCAVMATVYGAVTAIAMTTPAGEEILLDLADVRKQAPLWCGGMVLLTFTMAYFCGHAAYGWHRVMQPARP